MITLKELRKKYGDENIKTDVDKVKNRTTTNANNKVVQSMPMQVQQRTEELLDQNKKGFFNNLGFVLKSLYTGTEDTVAGWARGINANVLNQVQKGQQKTDEQLKEELKQLVRKTKNNALESSIGVMLPRNSTFCYCK